MFDKIIEYAINHKYKASIIAAAFSATIGLLPHVMSEGLSSLTYQMILYTWLAMFVVVLCIVSISMFFAHQKCKSTN